MITPWLKIEVHSAPESSWVWRAAHTYNLNTPKGEVGLAVLGWLWLHSKTSSQNQASSTDPSRIL